MPQQTALDEQGLESYPKGSMILGNLLMLGWFFLGAVACYYVYPFLGVIYFLTAFILVYVVLRALVCPNCYYYNKLCGLGWGKLSAALFAKGNIDDFPKSAGLKLAPAVYGLLMIIPLVLLIVSLLIQGFSWDKILVLVLLLLVSFYSGGPGRKKSCSGCKMKTMCPGCAVKKKDE